MKTRNIICAAMALLMSMAAMASNWRVRAVKEKEMKTITIELRDAEAFSLIDLNVAGDLEYTQSLNGESGVTLIVREDLADKVEATIHHGRLVIAYKRGTKHHFTVNSQLKVIAHSPALSVVSVNGSGDVMLRGPIRTESLMLHINGSGDVEAHDLTSQRVSVNINGSGDVQLAARLARHITTSMAVVTSIATSYTACTSTPQSTVVATSTAMPPSPSMPTSTAVAT